MGQLIGGRHRKKMIRTGIRMNAAKYSEILGNSSNLLKRLLILKEHRNQFENLVLVDMKGSKY